MRSSDGVTPRRMQFPTFALLLASTRQVLCRFPAVMACAVTGTATGWLLIHKAGPSNSLTKLAAVCFMGLPLLLSMDLFRLSTPLQRWVARAAGLIFLVLYYLTLPEKMNAGWPLLRLFILSAGFHFGVACAPFLRGHGSEHAVWTFNKTLCLRFCVSVLYSGVVFVGLALALATLDNLFTLPINEQTYFTLWVATAGLFNTTFFLAGVPDDPYAEEQQAEFPQGLRKMTQYTFIPLSLLYLVILYLYAAKILVTWTLPQGWVSYLVLGFSMLGILAALLIHPVRFDPRYGIIPLFARLYYPALFPMIGLMAVAIGRRISDYGITEKRYVVVAACVWLAWVSGDQLWKRSRSIRWIPVTLCAVCLLASFGPWNAGRVAYESQVSRLQRLLLANGVLIDGSIAPTPKHLDLETEQQVSSILQYVHSTHTLDEVQAWRQTLTAFTGPVELMTTMGMTYRHQGERERRFHVSADQNAPIVIKGFDHLFQFQVHRHRETPTDESPLGNDLVAWLEEDFKTLSVMKKSSQTRVRLDLAPLVLSMTSSTTGRQQLSIRDRTVERQAPDLHVQLVVGTLSGVWLPQGSEHDFQIHFLTGQLLVKE